MKGYAIVKYQIGEYGGTIQVPCNENDSNAEIIERAKLELDKYKIGMYHESYKVIYRSC